MDNMKKSIVTEFIGAYAIVFFGCGSVVVDTLKGGLIGHVAINVSFGVIVAVMIYAFGNVSGAHFNPAVTLAFAVSKKFEWNRVIPYIISQVLGGMGGAFMLWVIFPDTITYGENMALGTVFQTFVLEVVMSFFLMLIIYSVSTGHMEKGIMAGVAIGGYIAIEGYIAGPISSSSMNPARSIGPAIFSGNMGDLWIFILAPIIGALLAAWLHPLVTEAVEQ